MLRFLHRAWRGLKAEIVLGFLVGTVFWIALLGWQSAYAPTEIEKRQCEETTRKSGFKGEECKTLWERSTSDPIAFFTFWLSISTIGLWIVTWQSGKRQSKDMTASIDVAERALISGERAWVQVDIRAGGDLRIWPDGDAHMPLIFTLTNRGASPATSVRVFEHILLQRPGQKKIGDAYERFCRNVRERGETPDIANFRSRTLFPGEIKEVRVNHVIRAAEIKESCEETSALFNEPARLFTPFMVGCVAYRIPFDDVQHQTGFAVDFKRRMPNDEGYEGFPVFNIDQSVLARSEINIVHSPWCSPSID